MKATAFIAEENDGTYSKIRLESENQEEASLIMQMANSVKKPVLAYGACDKRETWAWFFIPNKKGISQYRATRFGNDET